MGLGLEKPITVVSLRITGAQGVDLQQAVPTRTVRHVPEALTVRWVWTELGSYMQVNGNRLPSLERLRCLSGDDAEEQLRKLLWPFAGRARGD